MFCGYCGKKNLKEYSFCVGCGKPLESGTLDQSLQMKETPSNPNAHNQERQDTKSPEVIIPRSKYLSVIWWKESPWPWQARSLDEGNLLGSYETEEKAAEVIAKFHGIDRIDLLIITGDSDKKKEDLLQKLRNKKTVEKEKSKATNQSGMPKPEVSNNDHISLPEQSRIIEHVEEPAPKKSVKAKTLRPDTKMEMHASLCSICKGSLPEELPYGIMVCSTNCNNKFWYKHYRFKLIAGSIFGLFFTLSTWTISITLSIVIGIITLTFANITIDEIKQYPWS
jgi:hypothetical protein